MRIGAFFFQLVFFTSVFISCKNSDSEIKNTKVISEKLEAVEVHLDSLLKRDIIEITEELIFMYEFDQALREYYIYKSFDKSVTDSIEDLPQDKRTEYLKNNNFQSDIGSKISSEYIIPFDEKHTERLIEITEKYGFPNVSRIKQFYDLELDKEFNPLILFIHSPESYWEDLKILAEEQYKAGNLKKCDYGYLLWHLNGRNDFQYFLDYGYEYVEENGIRVLKAVNCD